MSTIVEPHDTDAKPRSRLADHITPLLHDYWYIAALSSEVNRTMFDRTILEENILFFRQEDGVAVALQNRCPHRSYPLSRGDLEGDVVRCGYHGISYASSGACVLVPCQENVPRSFRLKSYPLVERGPFLWIWMGDPIKADLADLPELPWLVSPKFAHVESYFFVEASYIMLHENVLDMSHLPFLHGTGAATAEYASLPVTTVVDGSGAISVSRTEHETVAPVHYEKMMGVFGRTIDRTTTSVFATPAVHYAHDVIVDLDAQSDERERFTFEMTHAFTPATRTTTHYFWSNARGLRDRRSGDLRVSP